MANVALRIIGRLTNNLGRQPCSCPPYTQCSCNKYEGGRRIQAQTNLTIITSRRARGSRREAEGVNNHREMMGRNMASTGPGEHHVREIRCHSPPCIYVQSPEIALLNHTSVHQSYIRSSPVVQATALNIYTSLNAQFHYGEA